MDLPVIDTPVAPRWVWIEEITYSHIPIVTIVTAFMILAPIFEYIGWRRKDPRFERLAKSYIWFAMILFSPGSALGTGIPMWIIGAYPEFWSRWSNIFFWPLIAQFIFFLLEVFFLFFAYYLAWDAMAKRKGLHIFFGAVAAFWGICVQLVWDAVGGYMMTPGGAHLPGIDQPVAWSAAAFFNPSTFILFIHRFFGNISYVMLLTGGVFALRYKSKKLAPEEKAYFGWATNLMVTLGFLAFFAMPIIGWFYARCIQTHAPVAFHAIMGGHSGYTFVAKMITVAIFVLIGGTYMFARYKGKALRWSITAGLVMLWVFFTIHPPLPYFGGGMTWRAFYTMGIVGFIAFLWMVKGGADFSSKRWCWSLFSAGIAAFLAFCMGGFVREASKNPHTVYQEIEKPEATPFELDRFLVYDSCLQCHPHDRPTVLMGYGKRDWRKVLATEPHPEAAAKMKLTEEELNRIVTYLEENVR